MLTGGYIKLFRSLVSWEWYQDINVKTLFIHLLLTVNYEPNKWQGILIDKGQRMTSVDNLVKETKLSTAQIRGCLAKLRQTGEISIKTTNKYTLITVENYTKFQGEEIEDNKRITNEQQTDNKRITTKEESNKKAKESIKNIYSDSFTEKIKLYPGKKIKSEREKKLPKIIKEYGEEQIARCIERYAKEVKGTEQKYILNESTFWNGRYKDYLDKSSEVKEIKPQQEFIPTFVYRDL